MRHDSIQRNNARHSRLTDKKILVRFTILGTYGREATFVRNSGKLVVLLCLLHQSQLGIEGFRRELALSSKGTVRAEQSEEKPTSEAKMFF